MVDGIVELVEGAMGSPWVLAALFAVAAIDAFLPAVPSESLVVTAGVFAAAGTGQAVVLVILAAALGAFAGDHVSYLIGARAGGRVGARMGWARRALDDRGATILLVCRYVPGARTAVTLTAGSVRFPLRRFTAFDAAAAASWGVYSGMVGYLGGSAFEDDPLKGVLLGLGLAVSVAAVVEAVRHARRRGGGGQGRLRPRRSWASTHSSATIADPSDSSPQSTVAATISVSLRTLSRP